MEAVASGALQLVTTVAQDERGVQLLGEPRLFASLHAIAQWLLSPDGGGSVLEQSDDEAPLSPMITSGIAERT